MFTSTLRCCGYNEQAEGWWSTWPAPNIKNIFTLNTLLQCKVYNYGTNDMLWNFLLTPFSILKLFFPFSLTLALSVVHMSALLEPLFGVPQTTSSTNISKLQPAHYLNIMIKWMRLQLNNTNMCKIVYFHGTTFQLGVFKLQAMRVSKHCLSLNAALHIMLIVKSWN